MRSKYLLLIFLCSSLNLQAQAIRTSWVDTTLASMTLDEKIGQLFVVELIALYGGRESPHIEFSREMVTKYHVGGFILGGGTVTDIAITANSLQKLSRIPVFINGDLEAGMSVGTPWWRSRGWTRLLPDYVSGGGTAFPSQMAIGATRDTSFAREFGFVTAVEGRAIGIQWTNSPVADVNINPDNPIINTRSYGEVPSQVGNMVAAYVEGLQQGRMLATLKHFPGHGDTQKDSHMGLQALPFTYARLDSVELVPFRHGIAAGAKAVMTAHLALPRIDASGRPATLSKPILTGILRDSLHFSGLVMTDGMQMQGITDRYSTGEAAVLALEAGNDCVLAPPNLPDAFDAVKVALSSGRLSMDRIDASVRRVLEAKSWAGLDRNRYVDLDSISAVVGIPAHQRIAEKISDAAVTLLRNEGPVIPVDQSAHVHFIAVSDNLPTDAGRMFGNVLGKLGRTVEISKVTADSGPEHIRKVVAEAKKSDVIVVGIYMTIAAWKGGSSILGPMQELYKSLPYAGKPVITVAFGDPYVIAKLPPTEGILTPYFGSVLAEWSVARALAGVIDIRGKLPVTIPGKYSLRDGIQLHHD